MTVQFALKYLILCIAQVLLLVYLSFSQLAYIAILPVMILCLPSSWSAIKAMLLAFITGLAVDFLIDGRLGLCCASLVAVAFSRRTIIRFVFGEEIFLRKEEITLRRQGWPKFLISSAILTAIYLGAYILLDGAGTRALWIDIVKFVCSLIVSTALSMMVAHILCPEANSRWR